MALPITFGTLPAGNTPASNLDTMFGVVAGMGIIECTATGTNTIVLTPVTNMPTVNSYTALAAFSFVAAATNTGAVTVNISAVGAINLIRTDGSALIAGDIRINEPIVIVYDGISSFYLVSTPASLFAASGTTPGYRNWLTNASMTTWQRGAGGSASIAVAASTTSYTADRWYTITGANQACTISQQLTTVVGTRFAARVQRNNGQTGTGQLLFAQPLDSDVILVLEGQTCVISAQVQTGANWSPTSGTLGYKVYCGTGAVTKRGNTPYTGETAPISGTTNIAAGTGPVAITIATGAIPSNTTQMEVQFFWTPTGTAGVNDWFQITNVQLEVGSSATAFDQLRNNFPLELQQCQRFFEKSFPYGTAPAQNVGSLVGTVAYTYTSNISQVYDQNAPFKVTKRVAPTMTYFSPNAASSSWTDSGGANAIASSTTTVGDSGAVIHGASTTANTSRFIHFTADADI